MDNDHFEWCQQALTEAANRQVFCRRCRCILDPADTVFAVVYSRVKQHPGTTSHGQPFIGCTTCWDIEKPFAESAVIEVNKTHRSNHTWLVAIDLRKLKGQPK